MSLFRNEYVVENGVIFAAPFLLMAVFSKTVSLGPLEPLLALVPLSPAFKTVFSYNNLIHALAGAVGSVTAMTVFFPLDTARTRLQVDVKRKSKPTVYVLQEIVSEEGMHSLYRGMLPVLSSLYCSNFLYFYAFNGLKALCVSRDTKPTPLQDLMFGYIAGMFNVLVTTPLWVVNTRLKLQGIKFKTEDMENGKKEKYKGIVDGMRRITREEGLGTLWSGTGPSLVLAGNPAIQFMIYESLKRFMMKNGTELGGIEFFLIGAVAKAVATILTYPLQVAQCRQRSGHHNHSKDNSNIFTMLAKVLRDEGAHGMFRGLEAKLLQTVMTAALMFTMYEKIASFLFFLAKSNRR